MFFIYRFLDNKDKLLYIGKTNDMKSRMSAHFGGGHLGRDKMNKVKTVEYINFDNEPDQHVSEMYLINKHKPPFNTNGVKNGTFTLDIELDKEWTKYSIKGKLVDKNSVDYHIQKRKVAEDMLLDIRENIEDRTSKLWEATHSLFMFVATDIYNKNPEAFENNELNEFDQELFDRIYEINMLAKRFEDAVITTD